MKSENHEICLDVMVSHVDAVIKSWEDFAHFYHDDVYKIETSHKKYMCDCIWELVDVFFEYKLFIWSHMQKKVYTKVIQLDQI